MAAALAEMDAVAVAERVGAALAEPTAVAVGFSVAFEVAVGAPLAEVGADCVAEDFAVPVAVAVLLWEATAEPVAVEEQVARLTEEPAGHSEGQPHAVGALDPAGQKDPAVHRTCVAVQEPAGQKNPAAQSPSHAAVVRTEVERPNRPAGHCAVQEGLVSPVVAPYVPQAHKPLQVLAVCAEEAP